MKYIDRHIKVVVLVLVFAVGCRDPYQPKLKIEQVSILVVDSYLNASDGSLVVKLSRAISLSANSNPPAETKATLSLEEENGTSASLSEVSDGDYEASGLAVDISKRYRLNIQMANGKKYQSDFVALRQSPPVDSVTWRASTNGVEVDVTTHDPSNSTRYYQWTYEETWEYQSKYYSSLIIENGQAVVRPPDQSIYRCYRTVPSSNILINSTISLSNDLVNEFPLIQIEPGSSKLSIEYSVLVQQRALTSDAYNYWIALKKTTESLGGLFDPLPSQVTGNIHSLTDSSEPVLGYFTGGTVQGKRIFIGFYDLPRYLQYVTPSNDLCEIDTIKGANLTNYGPGTLLISSYGVGPLGYTTSSYSCIDCQSAGGVTTKPDYWP